MSRYLQQVLVPEIGSEGQKKIAGAKVLVVGAGGLGIPVATYLSAAGAGTIGIMDGDSITITNLHRQFLYNPNECGLNKAAVLQQKLKLQNPGINITAFPFPLTKENSEELISQYDIVCDATDNVEARILLDQACARVNKPLVYAAVRGWEGYLTVLNYKNKIRLQDIFSVESLAATDNCKVSGIVNTTCGTLGSLQANETLKIILNSESDLDGEILCADLLKGIFRRFKVKSSVTRTTQ